MPVTTKSKLLLVSRRGQLRASITESAGVPSTAKASSAPRTSILKTFSCLSTVMAWLRAERSPLGPQTQKSRWSFCWCRARARATRPGALTPSSLDTRILGLVLTVPLNAFWLLSVRVMMKTENMLSIFFLEKKVIKEGKEIALCI